MTETADDAGAAAQDPAWRTFARHHAFVVGIDAYANGIAPLRTAAGDARRLCELLARQHHFTVHPPLIDEGACGAPLRELFGTTMKQAVGPDDRVLFYFAGHGIAADGDDGPAGYIVPADAEPARLDTFIAMAELQAALDALPCRHLLLILDCCFSGAFKWSSQHRAIFMTPKRIYPTRFRRFVEDPARQVITSAAHDQKALDVLHGKATGERGSRRTEDGREHSPFAAALFDALEGAADVARGEQQEGDGIITATELYAYIRDRIEPATEATGERLRQTPSFFPLKGHDKGEFMFLHPHHRLNLPKMEPADSPYKGLDSFNEADQHLFYGRDRVVADLRQRALDAQQRLLVVAGPSGTGKSSVIKAGLLPELRKAGLEILPVMRPGAQPLAALERALEGATRPSVLLIDQYEEVVTRCGNAAERREFDERLYHLLEQGDKVQRLILTVRSDFEPQLNTGMLARHWARGRCSVPPFSPEELREVVVMPTLQASMIFEPPELVDTIVGEVVQSPGALPLLSYALSELFRAYQASGREDRALTRADFDRLGGVMGALRTRADALHDELPPLPDREVLRRVMLRMVSLEGDLAGRRVATSDLVFDDADAATVERVIERLVDARLVVRGAESDVAGDGTTHRSDHIEPAHDALVRVWPRLRAWIDQAGRENLILGAQVEAAAKALDRHRDAGYLWHDNAHLPAVLAELHKPHCWFTAGEAAFIRRSEQRRKARLMRRRALALATFTVVGVLGAWGWFEQRLAAGTIREAQGMTDRLLFDVMGRLQAIPDTRDVRVSLVEQVKTLQDRLSDIGARADHSTRYWTAVLDGDHAVEHSEYDKARSRYQDAIELIGTAVELDANWRRNGSLVYSKVGELEMKRAEAAGEDPDLRAAAQPYERALAIDRQLVAENPDNPIVLRDLYVSLYRLADLAHRDGRETPEGLEGAEKERAEQQQRASRERASELYTEAREVAARLRAWPAATGGSSRHHDPDQAQRDHINTTLQIGHIAFVLWERHAETAHRSRSLAEYRSALNQARDAPGAVAKEAALMEDLAIAAQRVAMLRMHDGEAALDAARNDALHAIEWATQLMPEPPTVDRRSVVAQALHYESQLNLARIEARRKRPDLARTALEQAARIARDQAGTNRACTDPQQVCWSDLEAAAWMEIGHLEADQRRRSAARQAFDRAQRVAAEPGLKSKAQRCFAAPKLPCPT
ncbi:caspase family protein [uncultured Piscinibacter sp.]|uniref:nSTAND1 domain-containing NTPase n=1 Tax=uncultured Piscinibacter sp. TaxID=1131835 RepID=UPI00261C7289|nr:caspase family protein [uncultured Piscinibacter sp.]